jgi:hypothetical protein
MRCSARMCIKLGAPPAGCAAHPVTNSRSRRCPDADAKGVINTSQGQSPWSLGQKTMESAESAIHRGDETGLWPERGRGDEIPSRNAAKNLGNDERFRVGVATPLRPSPEGTAEDHSIPRPFCRPFGTRSPPALNPALKRWLLSTCPRGQNALAHREASRLQATLRTPLTPAARKPAFINQK